MEILIPHLLITSCILSLVISEKRAIISFMLRNKGGLKYRRMRELMLFSLRKTGYQDAIVFIVAGGNGELDADDASLFQQYQVSTKSVSLINQNVGVMERGVQVYDGTLSKLHLWALTEYDQIIYYDSDFVFLKNPASAFHACGAANLCATVDRLIADNGGQGYFNSGFLVLRPNTDTFINLIKNKGIADGKYFPDQDLLNEYFKGKWTALPEIFNHMHCNQFSIPKQNITIAMHEKQHILKEVYPEETWVWNTFKSTLVDPNNEGTVSMMSTSQQPQLDTSFAMPPQPIRWHSAGGSATNRQNLPQWNVNQLDALEKRIRGRPDMLPPWIAPPPPPPSTMQSNARFDAVDAGGSRFRSPPRNWVYDHITANGGTARGMDSSQLQWHQQQQYLSQSQQYLSQSQQFQQRPMPDFGPIGPFEVRNRGSRLNTPMPLPLSLPMHLEQQNSKERGISTMDKRIFDYGRPQIGNVGLSGQAADKIALIDNGPTRPDVLSSHRRYSPNMNRAAVA